jgi:GNAT superfamily N-acetyltransferase
MTRTYKLPATKDIPGSLVARLAVSEKVKGQGVGSLMLFDAMKRCANVSREIGGVASVVDALRDDVVSFYTQIGFMPFEPGSRKLFIMMDTVEDLLAMKGMVPAADRADVGKQAG